MSDETIKEGDIVQSKRVPTLIGRVKEAAEDGVGVIVANTGDGERLLLTVLDYWQKVRD